MVFKSPTVLLIVLINNTDLVERFRFLDSLKASSLLPSSATSCSFSLMGAKHLKTWVLTVIILILLVIVVIPEECLYTKCLYQKRILAVVGFQYCHNTKIIFLWSLPIVQFHALFGFPVDYPIQRGEIILKPMYSAPAYHSDFILDHSYYRDTDFLFQTVVVLTQHHLPMFPLCLKWFSVFSALKNWSMRPHLQCYKANSYNFRRHSLKNWYSIQKQTNMIEDTKIPKAYISLQSLSQFEMIVIFTFYLIIF